MAMQEDGRSTTEGSTAGPRRRAWGRPSGAPGAGPATAEGNGPGAPSERSGAPRRVITTRRGLPTGRSVLGGLLVALAALGTYVAATGGGDGPTTRFAVATHDLAPGTTLGPADVRLVALELPTEQATGTFSDTGSLLGGALRGPVQSGSLLTDALVERQRSGLARADEAGGRSSEGSGDESSDGSAPYREVSVALPAAKALDGSLRPGDRVDVVATDGDASFVLVDRALVVASSGADRGSALGGGDVRVTLALPDATAAMAVAHGATAAELTLVRSTRAVDLLPDSYHLPAEPAAAASASTTRRSS